jgi:carbon-monoxide dehydrogenase small subunit
MSLGREASARRADPHTDVRASAEREASRSERHQPPTEPGCARREQEVSRDVRIEVTVNGEHHEADVWEGESLLVTLRDRLGLPGSKNACEQGECGSCSVLLDGELVCACLVLAAQADGHAVRTVEGLAEGDRLHPVQEAFAETGAVQCGFCTPGFIVAAADLLSRIPDPSDDEIREALSGNLCRCTGYAKILDAVRGAARR